MRKIATTAAVLLMAVATALPAPASAQSLHFGFSSWDKVSSFCERHPRDRDCRDFRRHRGNFGFNSFAAGLFGFALGAAIVSTLRNTGDDWEDHVARCEAEFVSYNWRTDMYLGFDGDYHFCRL